MFTEFGLLIMRNRYDASLMNKINIRVIMVWEGTNTLKERNTILKEFKKDSDFYVSYA